LYKKAGVEGKGVQLKINCVKKLKGHDLVRPCGGHKEGCI